MKNRELPRRMHFKDGGYYYVHKNKWTHLGGGLLDAMVRYRSIEHGLSLSAPTMPAWFSMEKYMQQAYWTSRKNAKKRGIAYELTREQFSDIVARANGRCEVTDIVFELRITDGADRRPFAPSLDRIDSAGCYTLENCRLVCGIVNAAMGAWGEQIFWKMVKAAKRKHRDCRQVLEVSESAYAIFPEQS